MSSWLELAALKHPARPAIEVPGTVLSYAQALEEVSGRARRLARDGTQSGDRIPLMAGDPLEFVLAFHACLLVGAAAVPIDLRLTPAEQAARAEGLAPGPDVAALMHTSGSTGQAKPVPLSPENFLASALGSAVALGLDAAERWLCPMPLTHVGGLSIPIRSAIYATTAILHPGFETEAVLEELMDPSRGVTLVSLVPTMLARLLDAGLERPPTLRWALLGGGPIAPALLERAEAAGVPTAPTYGMTEACSQIATFGWPLPGVELRLDGELQEILVRGPVVSRAAFSEDGWLHTGDLGSFDEGGRLQITGRAAETIITGGENVSPSEVEQVLLSHPSVADAAVLGRPDAEWGEAVIALVVCAEGARLEPEELRAHCHRHLAAFKVPKAVELTDRLPRTASGKLLRRELV